MLSQCNGSISASIMCLVHSVLWLRPPIKLLAQQETWPSDKLVREHAERVVSRHVQDSIAQLSS